MKKVLNHAIATALAIAVPYMIVGIIWLLSMCSFSYTVVVTNSGFLGIATTIIIILSILINFYVDQGDLDFFEW